MSEITIVYKELEDAAEKAREISESCLDYYDELNSKIRNKIAGVSASPMPSGNSRLNSTNIYIRNKTNELAQKSSNYKVFAKNCDNLLTNAKNADKRVGVEVNTSRENFLKEHTDLSGDGWNAFLATLVAEVPVLGWIVDSISDVQSWKNDVKNTIRKWYEIDGGKKIIDTVLAVVGVVVAVVGLVAAVTAGLAAATVGAAVLAVIGIIGATIGVLNAVTDICTQIKADTCKDPAFANFYGNQNSLATWLRKKTFRGGFKGFNNTSMGLATGLEVTELFCTIVSIGSGLKDIFKNSGIRDLCGKTVKNGGTDRYGREIDIFKYDFSDVKKTFTTKDGWKQIGSCVKKNWSKMLLGKDGLDGATKDFDGIDAAKNSPELKTKKFWKELPKKIFKNTGDDGKKVIVALENLNKTAKGYNRGVKLINTGIKVEKMVFDKKVYDKTDFKSLYKTGVDVTGNKGILKSGYDIYDTVNKALKYSANW